MNYHTEVLLIHFTMIVSWVRQPSQSASMLVTRLRSWWRFWPCLSTTSGMLHPWIITVKIVVLLLLAWLFYFHRFTGRLSMVIIEFLYKRFQKRTYIGGMVYSQMNESPVPVWPFPKAKRSGKLPVETYEPFT